MRQSYRLLAFGFALAVATPAGAQNANNDSLVTSVVDMITDASRWHVALHGGAGTFGNLLLQQTPLGAVALRANRAFTFGIHGRTGVARHQLNGLLVFAFCLAITSGSLFVLHRFDPTVGKCVELSVLVGANLVATLIRFVALRRVFSA